MGKCRLCQEEMGEQSVCQYCGLVSITQLNSNPEDLSKIIESHREASLKKIDSFELEVFSYKYENKRIEFDTSERIRIAGANECYNQTYFFSEKFARIADEKEIPIKIVVKYFDESERELDVVFQNPQIDDFWRIGLSITPELKMNALLGNEDTFSEVKNIMLFSN